MLDPKNLPEVDETENVTRFIMFSRWVRADETIRHDAFVPPDDLELSVTRLRQATDAELWQVGAKTAKPSNRSLHGRVDLSVKVFLNRTLVVLCDAADENPNHAKVIGWPIDKAQQMIVAKQIAATPGLRRIAPPAVEGHSSNGAPSTS